MRGCIVRVGIFFVISFVQTVEGEGGWGGRGGGVAKVSPQFGRDTFRVRPMAGVEVLLYTVLTPIVMFVRPVGNPIDRGRVRLVPVRVMSFEASLTYSIRG